MKIRRHKNGIALTISILELVLKYIDTTLFLGRKPKYCSVYRISATKGLGVLRQGWVTLCSDFSRSTT